MCCQLRIVFFLHVFLSSAIIAIPLSTQFAEIEGAGIARNFWMILTLVQGKSVIITEFFTALLTCKKLYIFVLSFALLYVPTEFVLLPR